MVDRIVWVHKLANELLDQFELTEKDWRFELSTTRNAIGDCLYNGKVIRFSIHYLKRTSDEEVEDTIRHEIAHALAGSKANHGPLWQAYAASCGARPEACAPPGAAQQTTKYNFAIECPNCEWVVYRHRLRRSNWGSRICSKCHGPLKFYTINHK